MKQILDMEETVPRYVTVKKKIGYTEYLMDRASMTTDASGKFSVDLYIKETREYIGRYLLSEIIYSGNVKKNICFTELYPTYYDNDGTWFRYEAGMGSVSLVQKMN